MEDNSNCTTKIVKIKQFQFQNTIKCATVISKRVPGDSGVCNAHYRDACRRAGVEATLALAESSSKLVGMNFERLSPLGSVDT